MRTSIGLLLTAATLALAPSGAHAASWSAATPVDPAFGARSVSCTTDPFCVAVGSAGQAVTFAGGSWSAPAVIDPGPLLTSVACPSATFCVAVDGIGNSLTYDGQAWSARTSRGPYDLESVSCASATFCVAVGSGGQEVSWNGTSWSAPQTIDTTSYGATLQSVSCPKSTSFCAAVDLAGNAFTYDGTTWSAAASLNSFGVSAVSCASSQFCLAVGAGGQTWTYDGRSWSSSTGANRNLSSVSCPLTSFCAAVDDTGSVVTYDGSSWSAATSVNATRSLAAVSCPSASFCATVSGMSSAVTFAGGSWSRPVALAGGGDVPSCASGSFCVAVDQTGRALRYDGSSWTKPTAVDGTNLLTSVSCHSASFCAAVDGSGGAVSFDGSSWSAPQRVDGTSFLNSVSCPTDSFCAALDTNGNAALYRNGSWTAATNVGLVYSVSCASASFCVAVGRNGSAATFDGSSWTKPTSIDGATQLLSVSCPSASFCAATDLAGNVLTFDGSVWSQPAHVDPLDGDLGAISCASGSFCAATDSDGNALTFDGSSWTGPTSVGGGALAVSCVSGPFCVVTDRSGNALTYATPGGGGGSSGGGGGGGGSGGGGNAAGCPAGMVREGIGCVTSPSAGQASCQPDAPQTKCPPPRPQVGFDGQTFNFDGVSRVDTAGEVGGVYAKIRNYSPWVAPGSYVSAWVNLQACSGPTTCDGQDYAQIGWNEQPGGNRETLIQFNYEDGGQGHPQDCDRGGGDDLKCEPGATNPQPLGKDTYYTVLFGNKHGEITFQVDGVEVAHASTDHWSSHGSFAAGETHSPGDQMPGDLANPELFQDIHVFDNGSWQPFSGTRISGTDTTLYGMWPFSGGVDGEAGGQCFGIWDYAYGDATNTTEADCSPQLGSARTKIAQRPSLAGAVATTILGCPVGATSCHGTVALEPAARAASAGARGAALAGPVSYALPPGASERVRLRLTRRALRALRRRGSLRVRLVVTAGSRRTSRTLVLKAHRRRR